jgi:hypothetical protein
MKRRLASHQKVKLDNDFKSFTSPLKSRWIEGLRGEGWRFISPSPHISLCKI